MKKFGRFLIFILLFPSVAGSAEVVTWDDVVREASQANPDYSAALDILRRSRSDVSASRSDFFPRVSVDSSYNAGNSASTGGLGIDLSNIRQEFDVGGSIRQNLFSGFKTQSGYRRSRALLTDSQANLLGVKAQVAFDLKTAFAQLLFAQDRIKLNESILKRRGDNFRLVHLRYEGGIENKGSSLRSEAQLKQAEYDLTESKRGLKTAQTDLARSLGRPEPSEADLQAKGSFKTLYPTTPPNLEALADLTPDVGRAAAQVKVAQADVDLAKGDLFPNIDAAGTLSRSKVLDEDSSNRWTAGVVLSYPFLLGGRDLYEIQGAKADRKRSEANLQSVALRVTADLKRDLADFKNAVERVKVQEAFVNAARVRSEIARSQYSNGLIQFFDWDGIENDLIQNERTLLESRRDAMIAEAQWERTQGKGAW